MTELETVNADADTESADWSKRSWDLPPYKSPEFLEQIGDLRVFRELPVYRYAVENGKILADTWVAEFPVKVALRRRAVLQRPDVFAKVEALAYAFLEQLCRHGLQCEILNAHQLGESSAKIQEAVRPALEALGFQSEKKHLFAGLEVAALRPDYFLPVENSGILLEVERGKTLANNMDLLDLWKCHICEHADYLFLLVPQKRQTAKGTLSYPFRHVCKRLGTFFIPQNYVRVEAAFIFGY